MIILQAKDLSVAFAGQKILDQISLAIKEKERIGLVGVNGSGKTTLLKCLTKQLEPDEGEIFSSPLTSSAYLEQLPDYDSELTLWEVVMDSFADLLVMRKELRGLELQMTAADETDLPKIMEKYTRVTAEYEKNDGYDCENITRKILIGLGFIDSEFTRPVNTFSGGQKTRLNIARLLALEPDILFLDEPTNHLDMDAVEWLEEYLQVYPGTIVVVSHDRIFLDKIATRIVELSHTKLYSYPGNYSTYLQLKAQTSAAWEKAYQKQQEYIKKTEDYIRRFKAGIKSKQAHGRQQQLNRLERIENEKRDLTIAPWDFKLQQESALEVLKVNNLAKSYDETLFKNVNIHLRKGDKVALIGPNGCGKTTLLKIILGEIEPDVGKVEIGGRVIMGYFSQQFEGLDQNKTILDEIIYNFDITIEKARSLLGRMLFSGDDVLKMVGNLSGGEKARVSILKLLLTGANFLVLDEPTNHLDIESRLIVEDMLAQYNGTILMVSHDRYFIDQIVDEILVFRDDQLVRFLGNYSDFHNHEISIVQNIEKDFIEEKPSQQQLHRDENKERLRLERKIHRDLSELETRIDNNEEQIIKIETKLTSPEIYADADKVQILSRQLEELQKEVLVLYEKWEKLGSLAEDYA
ncbi:MAG TPA: ABC-F family ATP-binding cassette domain-containing protein [Syntrophomonadaceae bacterium]|nr:ABC-F family ATP-binding cassette domain-containing protein [Syntrophomonadaceae bacterium]